VEFCEARDLDPLAVSAETGKDVARFFYWRTDSLLKGKSMGEQLRAAMRAHFAPTRGLSSWSVITSSVETVAPTFSGNPALSDDMTAMYKGHAITRARRGELEVRRVDPIEPCHLLRCWSKNFAGRTVEGIDTRMLMAYSSTLLCANLLLRYDELVMLRYVVLTVVSGCCEVVLGTWLHRGAECRDALSAVCGAIDSIFSVCFDASLRSPPQYGAHGYEHEWYQAEHQQRDEELTQAPCVRLPAVARPPWFRPEVR